MRAGKLVRQLQRDREQDVRCVGRDRVEVVTEMLADAKSMNLTETVAMLEVMLAEEVARKQREA